jgi:S-formylglutathione hydrolase FrmB
LSADPDPQRWAFGGLSFGGTCAIQMAALHPGIYPSVIDLSGEAESSLSRPQRHRHTAGVRRRHRSLFRPD